MSKRQRMIEPADLVPEEEVSSRAVLCGSICFVLGMVAIALFGVLVESLPGNKVVGVVLLWLLFRSGVFIHIWFPERTIAAVSGLLAGELLAFLVLMSLQERVLYLLVPPTLMIGATFTGGVFCIGVAACEDTFKRFS